MTEAVDLKPYILALLRRWRWLIGGALLAGVLAFGLSFLLPPVYQASVLVLVNSPDQLVEFDPRFAAVEETRPVQAYPELALSDSMVQTLAQELPQPPTIEEMRDTLSARASSDPGLLRLAVEHSDAAEAARLANKWAEIFLAQANKVVGDQNQEQVLFYTAQRDEAREALREAEAALARFQAGNRSRLLAVELAEIELALAEYRVEQRELARLQRDIATLRSQLQAQDGELLELDLCFAAHMPRRQGCFEPVEPRVGFVHACCQIDA